MPSSRFKWLLRVCAVLVALVSILSVTAFWLIATQSGAAWLVRRLPGQVGVDVQVGAVRGSLASTLELRAIRIHSPSLGADLEAQSLAVELGLDWSARRLRIERSALRDIRIVRGKQPVFLAGTLEGEGSLAAGGSIGMRGSVEGVVQLGGHTVPLERLRWRLSDRELSVEPEATAEARGSLGAAGWVRLGKRLSGDLRVRWHGVEWPLGDSGSLPETTGEFSVVGTYAAARIDGRLSLDWRAQRFDASAALHWGPGQIDAQRIEVTETEGAQPGAQLSAAGKIRLSPQIEWQLEAHASRFDPGVYASDWRGQLVLELTTRGRRLPQGLQAQLDLRTLDGTIRQRHITGGGTLDLHPRGALTGSLHLRSGGDELTLVGRHAELMDADVVTVIESLGHWIPHARGRVTAKLHLTGSFAHLGIKGTAHGNGLALGDESFDVLDASANVRDANRLWGRVRVTGRNLFARGLRISAVDLEADANEAKHSLHLSVYGQPVNLELDAGGSARGGIWAGRIDRLTFAPIGTGAFSLQQPAEYSFGPGAFAVSRSCLTRETASLCFLVRKEQTGEMHAQYSIDDFPWQDIARMAVPDAHLKILGSLHGEGDIHRDSQGRVFGEANLESAGARMPDGNSVSAAGGADSLEIFEELQMTARLEGSVARGSARVVAGDGELLEADGSVSGLGDSVPTVDGKASLTVPDISRLGVTVARLADVHGSVECRVEISGALAHPLIEADGAVRNLSAEAPQLGVTLRDGQLRASVAKGEFALEGQISSGKGELSLSGGGDAGGAWKLDLHGENLTAVDIPGARVIVAPQLQLSRSATGLKLEGTVRIPQADLVLEDLPQLGSSRTSADVIVVDAPTEARSREPPLAAKVTFVLGDAVHVVGYGFEGGLEGQLQVTERPGDPTLGTGQLAVTGTYTAYGQDLTIEEGHLSFANSPLDDPQLSITAVRVGLAEKVRLTVTGSVSRPQLQVSSDSAMSQSDALAYLVTGKPMSEVAGGQGDKILAAAARSLGETAGNALAQGLGKRVGVADVGIGTHAAIGGAALTVGRYLSPRLYMSYGVGLVESGQVLTLRYRLSDRLWLESVHGSQEQRGGLSYRIER